MLLWRNKMTTDNSRALSNLSQKKMATIILAVQIGNENGQINNSASKKKIQEKTIWLANYLFFISKKIIARKQILQVINMCYDAQPIFTIYPLPNRFV